MPRGHPPHHCNSTAEAAGIACGIAAALGVNRLLGRLLYEISPTDPASYALIALFLAGVAVLASAPPARRALDADPLDARRHEGRGPRRGLSGRDAGRAWPIYALAPSLRL